MWYNVVYKRTVERGEVMSKIGNLTRKIRVWGVTGVVDSIPRYSYHFICRCSLYLNYLRNRNVRPVPGVTVIANVSESTSNSKTTRDFIVALKEAGIPVQSFDLCRRRKLRKRYPELVTPGREFCVTKYTHVVEMFRSPLPDGIVQHRARIAFWEGESGVLAAFPYLAGPAPIIAMSDFNYEAFRRDLPSTTPVFKVPYPLRQLPADLEPKETVRARHGLKRDDFAVLFNFDIGSFWRKNPIAAVRSFARAFKDVANAKLVLKTNCSKAFPERIQWIRKEIDSLGISSSVVWIHDYVAVKELYAIVNACDVYLSLHRAEGFGIGIAEAMQLGKPVIVTDYSASTEFCRPDNSFPVAYRLVDIKPGEYFTEMRTWADADVDDAAKALRLCYDDPAKRREVGEAGRKFVEEHFSIENFRSAMNGILNA